MDPSVSVVIPTLGRPVSAANLAQALFSLTPRPDEVIVVFQDKDEMLLVRERTSNWTPPGPLVLQFEAERSVTAARNSGARAAVGELLAFVDDDCMPVASDWLSELCRPLRDDPSCVAVTGPVTGWPAAGRGVRIGRNAVPVVPLLCHPIGAAAASRGTRASTVWGGNFAVRRDAFDGVGGFRSDVFRSPCIYEETELSFRLRREGRYIGFVPSAAVRHAQETSGGQRSDGATFSPEFIGLHKRKLVRCVSRSASTFHLSLFLNACLFGVLYLARSGGDAARSYLRGLLNGRRDP